ncbi:hypothetical protein RE6C_02541 [Rhodopirellula europaea 6C]|uniref:Uncharacterized protein n=1 Tax=Rhodopirellula europaea 6C TaxID=1263867 RepID=M2A6V6_9BACT|nr:hypothetical protein RE6C_02541 [Rhodopirellula europaea 6C]
MTSELRIAAIHPLILQRRRSAFESLKQSFQFLLQGLMIVE